MGVNLTPIIVKGNDSSRKPQGEEPSGRLTSLFKEENEITDYDLYIMRLKRVSKRGMELLKELTESTRRV